MIVAGLFIRFRKWLKISLVPLTLFLHYVLRLEIASRWTNDSVILFLIVLGVCKQRGIFFGGADDDKNVTCPNIMAPTSAQMAVCWMDHRFCGNFFDNFSPFMGFEQQNPFIQMFYHKSFQVSILD